MKRLSHNSVELPSPSRKRPLVHIHQNSNSITMNISPGSASKTTTSTFSSRRGCKFQMKHILYSLVIVMVISSGLFVVRYHSITTFGVIHDTSSFLLPHHVRRRRRTSHQEYDRWKRPPSFSHDFEMKEVEYHFSPALDSSNMTLQQQQHYKTRNANDYCGISAQQAATNHGFMKEVLLKDAVVVISGILSPMGVSLALFLHKTCGVERIIGVDSILPNLRHARMPRMEYLASLQKHIPNFPRLVVPELGIPLDEIYTQYQPTHVVHFTNQYPTALENVYTMQSLLDSFLQLQHENNNIKLPHFVYISTESGGDTLSTNNFAVNMLPRVYQNVHGTTATTVGLQMPHVHGDYSEHCIVSNLTMRILNGDNVTTTTLSKQQQQEQQEVLFVEDAVQAIVSALQIQPPTGLISLNISTGVTLEMLQTQVTRIVKHQNSTNTTAAMKTRTSDAATITRHWLGWTPTTTLSQGASQLLSRHLSHKFPFGTVEQTLQVPTPRQRVEFPCASECARPTSCTSTVFDKTIKTSRPLTRGCKYVVYTVDLWGDLQDLPSSGQGSEDASQEKKWCRIAFVSSHSPLVQEVVSKHTNKTTTSMNTTILESLNGKVQYKNWTLVFVHGDAAHMSEAEFTLLKMTPKRFFSDTISRAMFVHPHRFPVPPFESLMGYFKSLDPTAKAAGRIKEYRPGVSSIFRFLPKKAKKARRVVFSSLEATFPNVPEKSPIGVYVQDLVQREGIRPNPELLNPQISYYTYAAHFVQNGIRRPEYEMRSTVYKNGFPFEWLKTAMIVHDLRETEARNLRCEWYDEHLFWGNTHLEDVSLAYILGQRKIMGRFDVSPEKEDGWFPIMDTDAVDETADEILLPERLTNADDAELFVRILPKPKS